ncbi:hypothetical protein BV22DRAFT_1133069 [Leucogyrophana mollusca]|uniref:Uncharacterized protein n=1 Tax=Leucogyrophana mollusca TaxID=85980 RepID=A0ACB8B4U2_9AGAM|nr:hypothetical protein BV22DRAFT_1133069 [Leucogyrophana mollusca]
MSLVGTGGLLVTQEMLDILAQPGFINISMGSERLRKIFSRQSLGLDARLLSPFALACFVGAVDHVTKAISDGMAPDLTGTETPFKTGYAAFVVLGAQRIIPGPGTPPGDHLSTLRCLLRSGAPPDVPNIVGMGALHHACTAPNTKPVLARALLQGGANVDYQDRYGDTPFFHALMGKDVPMVDLLMEYGADLDICEGNGTSVRRSAGSDEGMVKRHFWRTRNAGTARKKATNYVLGVTQCDTVHQSARPRCRPFSTSTAISVKPTYGNFQLGIPRADLTRQHLNIATVKPSREYKAPSENPTLRSMVIKIQVPITTGNLPANTTGESLLVYNRKRDFACSISKATNPAQYDEIVNTVLSKGVNGVKAYFAAELKSRDELVIKISEVLAVQPF